MSIKQLMHEINSDQRYIQIGLVLNSTSQSIFSIFVIVVVISELKIAKMHFKH